VVDSQVTTILVGTSVHAMYHFSSQQGSDVADDSDFSTIFADPGTYTITLTQTGSTIAEGTLTVTA